MKILFVEDSALMRRSMVKAAILLADRGLKFSIGLPSFDAGDERCSTVDANHPCYALIFECLGRTFAVQLCVQD